MQQEQDTHSNGWFTGENGGTEVTNKTTANITADNHTLCAQWTINNYTIIFDFGNGTVVNEILKYNETITYPENLTEKNVLSVGGSLSQRECLQMTQ